MSNIAEVVITIKVSLDSYSDKMTQEMFKEALVSGAVDFPELLDEKAMVVTLNGELIKLEQDSVKEDEDEYEEEDSEAEDYQDDPSSYE